MGLGGSRCCQEETHSRVETVELSTSAKAKHVGGARGAKVRESTPRRVCVVKRRRRRTGRGGGQASVVTT